MAEHAPTVLSRQRAEMAAELAELDRRARRRRADTVHPCPAIAIAPRITSCDGSAAPRRRSCRRREAGIRGRTEPRTSAEGPATSERLEREDRTMDHDEQPARPHGSPLPPPEAGAASFYPLSLAKLRGVTFQARVALKLRRITTRDQLLAAAAGAEDRAALARATKIAPEILTELVQRADMARVNGIGVVFGLMLEELSIRDVQTLARQDAEVLHARLREHNGRERLARRSPTPEEVDGWVGQARGLPGLVTYRPRAAVGTAA
jgi:hypothetical protein